MGLKQIPAYVFGFLVKDYHTESAGTAITEELPAVDGQRLALLNMRYTAQGTAHTASFMFANGTGSRNTASAAAASGQADIVCTDDPKDPAGNAAANNDIVAYQCVDGSWEFNLVSSIATKTITMQTNLAKAVAAGAKVMIFGVVTDNSSVQLNLPASATSEFDMSIVHPYVGEPFWLSINNITAAGFLLNLVMGYINK